MPTNQRNAPRFSVDDHVYLSAAVGRGLTAGPPERFVVVSVMPKDRAGDYQYRIKPMVSGPHRVVTELELRR